MYDKLEMIVDVIAFASAAMVIGAAVVCAVAVIIASCGWLT